MSVFALFWFLAGFITAVALLLLLWPWLRAQSATKNGRYFGLPGWAAAAVVIALAGTIAVYAKLGSPPQAAASDTATEPHGLASGATGANAATTNSAGSMDAVVGALEARLRTKPGTDADWELLAKSYEFMNRPDAAALARAHKLPDGADKSVVSPPVVSLTAASEKLLADALAARQKKDFTAARAIYQRLAAQQQMNADAWADYADVTAASNGNSLAGEPEQYLQRALQLDPRHSKALWLQGSFEHGAGRYVAAVATWRRLAAVMDPISSDAKLIAANLAEDQQLAGTAPSAGSAPQAAGAAVAVSGEVTISDVLRSKIKPGMTLYILAKSVNSPGAPVAALRTVTGSWPVQFSLDDSMAMLPERKLSTAGMVTIEARISLSGQALAQPGDLLGSTPPLNPRGAKPLKIVIQKVVG
jgi:cytochrome c-type biogenesis protein CcmH